MAKRTDIKKILIIGSGPIVIGQAAEFDYAGTQACLALKEEGYEVVLVNSNPATIMTDTTIADKVYMEPLTLEYVAKILRYERPDAIVPGIDGVAHAVYNPKDIEDIAAFGRVKMFRGCPIVELPQSFLDEKNEQVMINPQFAYVLPSGKEKVVKIAMEGGTQMYDVTNPDQSIEIHTYRKIGVGILAFNNWGIYKNTAISVDNWYNPARLGVDVSYNKI